jgi:hypothetical protein
MVVKKPSLLLGFFVGAHFFATPPLLAKPNDKEKPLDNEPRPLYIGRNPSKLLILLVREII